MIEFVSLVHTKGNELFEYLYVEEWSCLETLVCSINKISDVSDMIHYGHILETFQISIST